MSSGIRFFIHLNRLLNLKAAPCFSSGSFSADSTFSSFLSHRNICFSICEWRRRSDPHCITKAPRARKRERDREREREREREMWKRPSEGRTTEARKKALLPSFLRLDNEGAGGRLPRRKWCASYFPPPLPAACFGGRGRTVLWSASVALLRLAMRNKINE